MAKAKINLIGMTFGKLTVLQQAEDYVDPKGKHRVQWLCECSCEEHNKIIVVGSSLTRKKCPTRSCGCLQKELAATRLKKYNKYDLTGEYGIGWTSNTNREFYFDLEDYEKIKDYCWCEHISKGYHSLEARDTSLKINDKSNVIKFHYIVFGTNADHINRNTMDNRKNNLRIATQKENTMNRTKSKNKSTDIIGVSYRVKYNDYQSYIQFDGKLLYLGVFNDLDKAVKARLKAEMKYFGKFSPQQHLFEQYGIISKEDNTE